MYKSYKDNLEDNPVNIKNYLNTFMQLQAKNRL